MTAVVTGANGFVGAAVCRALCRHGYSVRAMVRSSSDTRNLDKLPVDVVHGDLQDAPSIAVAMSGCSAVFHVAADYRLWVPNPETMYDINVAGTRRVIEAAQAARVERIVYTSSVAAIAPRADGRPAAEHTPTGEADMIGHYKRSKFLAEKCVADLVAARDVPVVIVNPSTPVGPGDLRPTPTGRIIRDAMFGRLPAFVDTGLNIVHVDDVADGHILALQRGQIGRRYILGGEDLSLEELLTMIAAMVDRPPPRFALPRRLALGYAFLAEMGARMTGREPAATVDGVRMSQHKMYYSSARAREELGYESRDARSAVADAVDWFQRHTNER